MNHPKVEFANRVLSLLESQEDWDEGTIDDVAAVAFELGLADTSNSTGLFKDLQKPDPVIDVLYLTPDEPVSLLEDELVTVPASVASALNEAVLDDVSSALRQLDMDEAATDPNRAIGQTIQDFSLVSSLDVGSKVIIGLPGNEYLLIESSEYIRAEIKQYTEGGPGRYCVNCLSELPEGQFLDGKCCERSILNPS